MIHYRPIASANQVMKESRVRNRLTRELGILCFEMEAAGPMDSFPCLVTRRIYAIPICKKNKQWQGYAAATVAALYQRTPICYTATRAANMPKALEKRENLMEALRFDAIDARQETVKAANVKACEWLLSNPSIRTGSIFTKYLDTMAYCGAKGSQARGNRQ